MRFHGWLGGGKGFAWREVADAVAAAGDEMTAGRGLMRVRGMALQLTYNSQGNEVTALVPAR